jgi:transcriptional regulator with XRE-family HTH domain
MQLGTVYLPGTIRERIQDLLKEHKMTQAELAAQIGSTESTLSRFISGKTDKLGDESIIAIARVFNVSTDFLLGEVDIPDRKNYDISELGLSAQAARNLYTGKANAAVVSRLLENKNFLKVTHQIERLMDDQIASGFAAQNQMYASLSTMLAGEPAVAKEVSDMKTPIYQAELTAIQNTFMMAVKEMKKDAGTHVDGTKAATKEATQRIFAELQKNQERPNQKVEAEQLADAVAQSVAHLPGVETDEVKKLFLSMIGAVSSDETGTKDQ